MAIRKPNIILITASQLRWDCLGYAGNPDVHTPNLDVLASHAAVFEQAIASCPNGAAARATLLTGHYPGRHGVFSYGQAMRSGLDTLPALLREAGYETGMAGMLQATPASAALGFDRTALAEPEPPGRGQDEYHLWLREEGQSNPIEAWDDATGEAAPIMYWNSFGALRADFEEKYCSTTWIGDRAVRGICTMTEPFFLWVSFIKPRPPFDPPPPWDGMYDRKALHLPEGFRLPVPEEDCDYPYRFNPGKLTETRFRRILAYYYAHISLLDRQIGRILATLTARGITNNILVFTADYGCYMGQHGLVSDGGPPYDSLLRIPLIIGGLPQQRRGIRETALVEQADLMPTLLHAVAVRRPRTLAGESLLPLLQDTGAMVRNAAYAQIGPDLRMVRTHRYKLVEGGPQRRPELYDLRDDPHEFKNLFGAPAMAAIQSDLSRELRRRAGAVE
jgi:arylsulfatase A-like enzyme